MVLKLYGYPYSNCTKRAAVVFHEKDVPFELVNVDMVKGEHKSLQTVANQPFGQLPYIDDEGFILYESRAIGRYIAKKYASQGTPLLPADLKAWALFEQASSVEQSNFDPFVEGLFTENILKKSIGQARDEAHHAELLKKLEQNLDAYEVILSKRKYVAGNELTLADLFHLPYASTLSSFGVNILESRPNVARWWKEISSRPSWLKVKDGVN